MRKYLKKGSFYECLIASRKIERGKNEIEIDIDNQFFFNEMVLGDGGDGKISGNSS